jgi:hypothetical protein
VYQNELQEVVSCHEIEVGFCIHPDQIQLFQAFPLSHLLFLNISVEDLKKLNRLNRYNDS